MQNFLSQRQILSRRMARAIPLNETYEEWSANTALIRYITSQEQQAKEDRMLAVSLAEEEIHSESDESQGSTIFRDNADFDDDDQEDELTGQLSRCVNI
jgi:hypothetical protein